MFSLPLIEHQLLPKHRSEHLTMHYLISSIVPSQLDLCFTDEETERFREVKRFGSHNPAKEGGQLDPNPKTLLLTSLPSCLGFLDGIFPLSSCEILGP